MNNKDWTPTIISAALALFSILLDLIAVSVSR